MILSIRDDGEIHLKVDEFGGCFVLEQPEDPRIRAGAKRDDLSLLALGRGQEGVD